MIPAMNHFPAASIRIRVLHEKREDTLAAGMEQRVGKCGRAYSHRIPLAELKCVSPKRRLEMAAPLGGEPGGPPRGQYPRPSYFPALFPSGARDERRFQP